MKEEFQAVMQYLIVPLIQKEVQKLVDTDAVTFSGQPMHQVVDEWKRKLEGCYQCLKEHKWECTTHTKEQAMDVSEKVRKAVKAATRAEARAASAAECLEQAKLQLRHEAEVSAAQGPSTQATPALSAAARVLLEAEVEDGNATRDACAARETLAAAQAAEHSFWDAWKPTKIPYFLSMDNSMAHSVYEGKGTDRIAPGMHLLQVTFWLMGLCCVCSSVITLPHLRRSVCTRYYFMVQMAQVHCRVT